MPFQFNMRSIHKMKTYIPAKTDIKRQWYLVDADGQILGRLASKVANILRGKNKVYYTPNFDTGDFVVVVNAEKIRMTGKKLMQKISFSYSGYPGGTRFIKYKKLLEDSPEKAIRMAVKGMLPHNKLSDRLITKLKVYRGAEHRHGAQKPERISQA